MNLLLFIVNMNSKYIYFFSMTEQTICPQRKIWSPEHCWKLERWQGLPPINEIKQYEIVLYSVL